jgi:CDP-glucose 4,6-dehydratase
VIGGGDFSEDRLIPDFMAAIGSGKRLYIRNPEATRPWQHVLEPLAGYLLLAEKLWHEPARYTQGWNFGPAPDDIRPVRWIVEKLRDLSSHEVAWDIDTATKPHEARSLVLDSTKARTMLGWKPRWTLDHALRLVVDWYESYERGDSMRDVVLQQITSYETGLVDDVALTLVHTSVHLPSDRAASVSY